MGGAWRHPGPSHKQAEGTKSKATSMPVGASSLTHFHAGWCPTGHDVS